MSAKQLPIIHRSYHANIAPPGLPRWEQVWQLVASESNRFLPTEPVSVEGGLDASMLTTGIHRDKPGGVHVWAGAC